MRPPPMRRQKKNKGAEKAQERLTVSKSFSLLRIMPRSSVRVLSGVEREGAGEYEDAHSGVERKAARKARRDPGNGRQHKRGACFVSG